MVNKKYSVMQQDHRQPRCNVRLHSIAKYISRRHHFQNLLVITLSLMHFFLAARCCCCCYWPFSRDIHLQLSYSYCVVLSYFSFVSILISALVWKFIALEFVAQRV